jgi:hypothetical protein
MNHKGLDPYFKAYLEFVRTLMRKRSVSRDARCLAIYLTTFENLKTNKASPGQRTICRDLQMSRRTLQDLLDELYEKGLVLIEFKRTKNGKQCVYTLIAPQPDAENKTPGNVVPFRSRKGTNSNPSTTRSAGNSASI